MHGRVVKGSGIKARSIRDARSGRNATKENRKVDIGSIHEVLMSSTSEGSSMCDDSSAYICVNARLESESVLLQIDSNIFKVLSMIPK